MNKIWTGLFVFAGGIWPQGLFDYPVSVFLLFVRPVPDNADYFVFPG